MLIPDPLGGRSAGTTLPIPIPDLLDYRYESIARTWSARFVAAKARPPTGKSVLCVYVSTIDRVIPVTEDLIQKWIDLARVDAAQIRAALRAKNLPYDKPTTLADVVLDLLWCIAHQGDRVKVTTPELLDQLNNLFTKFHGMARLGGAPGSMVDALTRLCGEKNAAIFTVFHSDEQREVFEPEIAFLTTDAAAKLRTVDAKDYQHHRDDRRQDPEVRNYPLEYQKGEMVYDRESGDEVSSAGPNRLICATPYRYYHAGGKVDRTRPEPLIERIFQFPGLTDRQRDQCVRQIARTYHHMILAGLQSAAKTARPQIEQELHTLCGQVTLHVELSGTGNLDWLKTLIPRFVSSVGVNDDELPAVCDVLRYGAPTGRSYHSLWDVLLDARFLAATFELPRLYVHTHTADLILRRAADTGPNTEPALLQEILADLFAKFTVTRWLGVKLPAAADSDVGLQRAGLNSIVQLMAQVVGLADKPLLRWLGDTWAKVEVGYFCIDEDYAVAVVPVAWFLGPLTAALMTTGAGDRTSAVSFVQSGFAQPRPRRP
jgi:ADP-dependent phosphofructokinase/glucokinase